MFRVLGFGLFGLRVSGIGFGVTGLGRTASGFGIG